MMSELRPACAPQWHSSARIPRGWTPGARDHKPAGFLNYRLLECRTPFLSLPSGKGRHVGSRPGTVADKTIAPYRPLPIDLREQGEPNRRCNNARKLENP